MPTPEMRGDSLYPPRLSEDQLETELHLLVILLKRHRYLVTIHAGQSELTIDHIEDNSAELHKSVHLFAKR